MCPHPPLAADGTPLRSPAGTPGWRAGGAGPGGRAVFRSGGCGTVTGGGSRAAGGGSYLRVVSFPALPLMTNWDPGSTTTSPSAEPVMVTSVSVALPRAPP